MTPTKEEIAERMAEPGAVAGDKCNRTKAGKPCEGYVADTFHWGLVCETCGWKEGDEE